MGKNGVETWGDEWSRGTGELRKTCWRKQVELPCRGQGSLSRPGGTVRPSRDVTACSQAPRSDLLEPFLGGDGLALERGLEGIGEQGEG